ncbi:MAG: 30S ribosomal protein S6 [bacterium]|nr:30S ribosomal protein S6 [bacterium]
MRDYELTVISKGEFDLAEFLKKLKVKIIKESKSVERPLAYPIAKQTKGVYSYVEVEMDPSAIAELENQLRLENKIIRHLIVWREDR